MEGTSSGDIRPHITKLDIGSVDVLFNIFNLHSHNISRDAVFDWLHFAIGRYTEDSKRSWIRTFNLFYWIGRIFNYIAGLPFRFLDQIGFDSDKAESSIIGRCIKGLILIIQVFAAILAILYYLDYLEWFKKLIQ